MGKEFQLIPIQLTDEEEIVILQLLYTLFQMDFPIEPIKAKEVETTIFNDLNSKKTSGQDLITGLILRYLPPKGI